MGHPEYADCLFRTSSDRAVGEFLHLDLAAGKGIAFLGARITVTPERIQRKRTKGWTSHGAKYVGRGTRWGNPWVIAQTPNAWVVNWAGPREVRPPAGLKTSVVAGDRRDAHVLAVELYRIWVVADPARVDRVRAELAGRDLMCWCAESLSCHADVLLELARGGKS
ncbi:DUF4326 domain-containing protein [Streptomyces sp. BR123]|nr:DUF4326 domain-containing protein [Streptomyces sp. BR123]